MKLIEPKVSGNKLLVAVFQNGFENPPTLKYHLDFYEIEEGQLIVVDPRNQLPKRFPVSICTVDEVGA